MGSAAEAAERRLELLRWTAGLGAVTAEALAYRSDLTLAAARARLQAAAREGLLAARRPLREQPALYVATPAGLRAAARRGLEPCRVSPAGATHLAACAAAAAALERCYPAHRLRGERELRQEEREHGALLASASMRRGPDGAPQAHRPDLVLWPRRSQRGALPVAVEVELSLKAPRRLQAICLAWARCRLVAGVLYLAAPEVERALLRALARTRAEGRVIAVPLRALPGPIARFVPSGA